LCCFSTQQPQQYNNDEAPLNHLALGRLCSHSHAGMRLAILCARPRMRPQSTVTAQQRLACGVEGQRRAAAKQRQQAASIRPVSAVRTSRANHGGGTPSAPTSTAEHTAPTRQATSQTNATGQPHTGYWSTALTLRCAPSLPPSCAPRRPACGKTPPTAAGTCGPVAAPAAAAARRAGGRPGDRTGDADRVEGGGERGRANMGGAGGGSGKCMRVIDKSPGGGHAHETVLHLPMADADPAAHAVCVVAGVELERREGRQNIGGGGSATGRTALLRRCHAAAAEPPPYPPLYPPSASASAQRLHPRPRCAAVEVRAEARLKA
jgi:hypothetical protein